MAKISSTLELIDRSTQAVEKNINNINKLTNAMKTANNTAADVDIASPIADAGRAAESVVSDVRQLDRSLENLDSQSPQKLIASFGGLSKAIIVVNQGVQLLQQGYNALSKIMTNVDNRTSADARLSLIRDELHTQEQLEIQIMRVANASGAEYEATAGLISKIGRIDMLKGNNDVATRFADIVNKSFVVSGASASEMNGAVRQLTQALASGVLRGDEFNSVMENAPILQELIAKKIGVTQGELRSLASDGKLTAEVVAEAILSGGAQVDEMFSQLPMTFERGAQIIENYISQITDYLSQPGQAFDLINQKLQEFIGWLQTANGIEFMTNVINGVSTLANGFIWLLNAAVAVYNFFSENWSIIEPIFWGLIAALTALTVAQWAYNIAMYACPITWIIALIVVVIGLIVGLIVWFYNAMNTNIEFKTSVISVWNSILNFFDQIPLFFQYIAMSIANAFSVAKITTLTILQELANGAIDIINSIIEGINTIPGISINTLSKLTFATDAAAEEQKKIAERSESYDEAQQAVQEKADTRQAILDANKKIFEAESAKKQAETQNIQDYLKGISGDSSNSGLDDTTPVNAYVTGGGLDKEVDISNQSLEYLNDIAENKALKQFDTISAQMEVISDDSKLSEHDREILMNASGAGTKIYYLSYAGGINMSNNINRGENWEAIKQKLKDETQSEIDVGISDLEEVLMN